MADQQLLGHQLYSLDELRALTTIFVPDVIGLETISILKLNEFNNLTKDRLNMGYDSP